MGKTGNGTVAQSEESIALMTPYRLPHHRYRSFAAAQDDSLPSAVILNGVKKALRERWETGW
ncbi:MAG: hypothetical protein ACLRP4_07720 [Dialister invisus]|uniref:hypothetical protein n=1 Tax=Dialister invisus TaxID=218538 RepID=UPI002E764E00|nr:hypothetical protein [Dialister invisus]MEE1473429.1 hypothetical protein [Dialister invisus]